MQLLDKKIGLVMGIANEKSVAYAVAERAVAEGARLILTYQNEVTEKRVRPLAQKLNVEDVYACDVGKPEEIEALFAKIEQKYQGLDFFVHSLAYADKNILHGRFSDTPKDKFLESLDISAYSLIALAHKCARLSRKPSSIVTLSYLGAQKVVPGYNLMGVSKAALEASVRYLAYDLGPEGIRVNAISAGPIRTLAASAIKNLKTMLHEGAQMSPLKRSISTEDVAKSCLYFLSDLSSGVTGEVHFVDAGFNIVSSISSLASTVSTPEGKGN